MSKIFDTRVYDYYFIINTLIILYTYIRKYTKINILSCNHLTININTMLYSFNRLYLI